MFGNPITHHPTIFPIGPFTIGGHTFGPLELTGFGISLACAFLIADFVTRAVLRARGDDPEIMGDVTIAAIVGTAVGGKIYYAILHNGFADLFTRDGIVFWGGFIGAVLLCSLTILWRKKSVLRFADGAAAGIAAGYSVGRAGCWAVGDDYGRVWNDGWLAVSFPEGIPPSTAGVMRNEYHATISASIPDSAVVSVYPTQLIETALGFVMFLILWRFRRSAHAPGWLFGMYCVLAGVERMIVEMFRAKSDMVGFVTSAQIVALIVFTIGVILLATRRRASFFATPVA